MPLPGFTVRRFVAGEGEMFRALRQRALAANPEAFLTTLAEDAHRTVAHYEERLSGDWSSRRAGVLGAFDPAGAPFGMVGFLGGERAKTRHRASIWGTFVDSAWRGRGAGRALMERALSELEAAGCFTVVELGVVTENTSACRLYDALGFTVCGLRRDAMRADGRSWDEELRELRLPRSAER